MGGPHAEVDLKPQLSPRGHETKEEELTSLFAAAQTMELHPNDWIYKLSTFGTSEWSINAPAAKMGLVNSCGLCRHVHMEDGPGQSLSCSHSAHIGSRSIITAITGPDFSGSMLMAC